MINKKYHIIIILSLTMWAQKYLKYFIQHMTIQIIQYRDLALFFPSFFSLFFKTVYLICKCTENCAWVSYVCIHVEHAKQWSVWPQNAPCAFQMAILLSRTWGCSIPVSVYSEISGFVWIIQSRSIYRSWLNSVNWSTLLYSMELSFKQN